MSVIQIENLWKEYRLGVISHGTLTQDLQSWWARIQGREDPNSKIPTVADQEKQIEGDRLLALRGINLEIKEGEVLGIIGKNGAGKSTLLKVLSRVTAPTKGSIKVKGRIASLLEVGTGFHPELTGRENIFMNGAIFGMSRYEINNKLDEIIAFSEIADFIDTPVKRYSSGMYVRLAFAVAAHLDPEILIIDEVLAVGDAAFQKKCLGKMNKLSTSGRTILFVSHNMNAINNLCSECIFLYQGELISRDVTNKVIDQYLSFDSSEATTFAEFSEHSDRKFQVLSLGILCDGHQPYGGIIKIDQQFTVQIRYKILESLSGGYGTFTIRNQRDEVVLFSDSRDCGEIRNHLDQKGIVEVNIEVPSPLLVPGKYSLSVAIAKQGKGAIDWHKDVVRFEVIDTEGVRGQRSGFIFKPLIWNTKEIK